MLAAITFLLERVLPSMRAQQHVGLSYSFRRSSSSAASARPMPSAMPASVSAWRRSDPRTTRSKAAPRSAKYSPSQRDCCQPSSESLS